jgi:hypothetical protein
MNAHRLIATAVSTAAVSTAVLVGIAPAQAEMAQRPDMGEPASQAAETSGMSAGVFEGDSIRISSLSGRARATTTDTPARDRHVWSYTEDGTLELRINGVLRRHHGLLI